jgi:hypothetical protein
MDPYTWKEWAIYSATAAFVIGFALLFVYFVATGT